MKSNLNPFDRLVAEEDQPHEIPSSWLWVEIGALSEVIGGGTPTSTKSSYFDGGTIPWVTPADMSGYSGIYISEGRRNITEEGLQNSSARLLPKNTLLFSSRAPIGYVAIAENPITTNQGFKSFPPTEAYLPRYGYWYLRSIKTLAESMASGTTFLELSGSKAAKLPFPLPPLAEQSRIVAKLDEAMQRIEASQERLEKLPGLLKQFRQAVLAAAVSGRLTEAWRAEHPQQETGVDFLNEIIEGRKIRFVEACAKAESSGKKKPRKVFLEELPDVDTSLLPELPSNWTATTVGFLAHVTKLAGFEYTNHIKYQDQGDIPVVRAQNVQMGHFSEENLVYIDLATSDFLERSQLHGREVLMVFIGAGTGNVCLTPSNRRWHLAPNVAKIDCDVMLPEYLNYYLQSPVGLRNTLSFVKATAQPSLSMETIREVAVAVPNLAEQLEIVRQVNHYFTLANALEDRFEQAAAMVEQLPQALLAKAFSGQLVPQDPDDEPASVLLERMKMAAANSPAKGIRKVRTKTADVVSTKQTRKKMKGKPVKTLPEFVERLTQLGGKVEPKQLLIEFDLQEDVDSFFELLRDGKAQGLLNVPTGAGGLIELA